MLTLRYSAGVRLILLCLFLVLPGVAQGAQRGTQLTGVVLDSSGAPIAGAAVNVG